MLLFVFFGVILCVVVVAPPPASDAFRVLGVGMLGVFAHGGAVTSWPQQYRSHPCFSLRGR